MSFFQPLEPPEPPTRPPQPAGMPPRDGVLGGHVPLRVELARTAEVVVLLGPMEARPEGVRITLQTRSRRPDLDPMGHMAGPGPRPGVLRLGVQYPDGRTTESNRVGAGDPFAEPAGPVLSFSGGGGGGGTWRQELWLWPLPPPGPLRFVVLWEDAGIEETAVEVDGQAFVDAAAEAEALWEPMTPEEEAAAHQAMFDRHRRASGGGFSVSSVAFGASEPAADRGDDDPSGDDDEYL